MKIILEGADGTGKTTLAKLLADKYGLDLCHCTQADPKDYAFYSQTIRKENVVWDRHCLSEVIYRLIFDRPQELTAAELQTIIRDAKADGVKIFVLVGNPEDIGRRLIARGDEDPKVLERLDWINDQYLKLGIRLDIPIIDMTYMTLSEIFDLIENPVA